MRKKIAVGVGQIVLVLAIAVAVCDRLPQAEPPLWVGMTADEVTDLLGDPDVTAGTLHSSWMIFFGDTDWLGNRQWTYVTLDASNHVLEWATQRDSRTRPPWLNDALMWLSR